MSPEELSQLGRFILNAEARRDADGHLKVYALPEGDGGGSFEVGGINDRFDHHEAYVLKELVEQKKFAAAEVYAQNYYIENTNGVQSWAPRCPAVEVFLRDTVFNRGLKGAAKVLQMALRVKVDGIVGPATLNALRDAIMTKPAVSGLLVKLRAACEAYERIIAPPVGARAKFWKGLNNRWDKRLAFAEKFNH